MRELRAELDARLGAALRCRGDAERGGIDAGRPRGAADGRRERPEPRACGEPGLPRHRGDPRQRDDDPRRRGVRRAGCLRRKARHYRQATGSGRRRLPRHVAGCGNPVVTGR